ncbi:MAG: non-hydrolyzing UDP-N-acetylglucosamine 2-epimerase [Promethearchaeota archaeon]
MRIITVLGTRPEIIRLSLIIKKLDKINDHVLIHTGQNFDSKLSDIFFKELELRPPDYYLGAKSDSFGEQISIILREIEKLFKKLRPDKVLILGDTNSGLAAIIAERMMIPVYHMEAGNRCYDLKVPEEKNRKIIDSISTFAIPYTPNSRENLIKEGIPKKRIFESGNPIYEVLMAYMDKIEESNILSEQNLKPMEYFLVTAHREENVDLKGRLEHIIKGLELIAEEYNLPIICSIHPRTKNKLKQFNIKIQNENIKLMEPFGFFDFVKLEKNAKLVLTDSGTVQEECCIFKIPTVTMRDTTERPETIECGSNIISGLKSNNILNCTKIMLSINTNWVCPKGYIDKNVSNKIIKFLNGVI